LTSLYHFYHVYADGKWEAAADEHITALQQHGLADALDGMYLGIVGNETNRSNVKTYFTDRGVNYYTRVDAPLGWEQVTLDSLQRHMIVNDGYVLYAHTKGSYNDTPINIGWRSSMCYHNVVRWEEAISHLDNVDTVGCHWVNGNIWGGNYWWATGRHIRTLKPLQYSDRWKAELWIGQREEIEGLDKIKIHDLNPGWPDPQLFTTSW